MLDVARTGDRGWVRGIQTETGPRRAERPGITVTNPLELRGRQYEIRFSQGVRTGHWLYVEHASGERELYDLRRDPRQFVNLAGRARVRAVQRLLARELDRLRDCAGAECNAPLPEALRTDDPAPAWVPRTMAGDPLTLTR
jgi:hypothetical protein